MITMATGIIMRYQWPIMLQVSWHQGTTGRSVVSESAAEQLRRRWRGVVRRAMAVITGAEGGLFWVIHFKYILVHSLGKEMGSELLCTERSESWILARMGFPDKNGGVPVCCNPSGRLAPFYLKQISSNTCANLQNDDKNRSVDVLFLSVFFLNLFCFIKSSKPLLLLSWSQVDMAAFAHQTAGWWFWPSIGVFSIVQWN